MCGLSTRAAPGGADQDFQNSASCSARNRHRTESEAGSTADDYVRTTVVLAVVLFLVGISTQFPLRGVRYGLIGVGGVLLVVSVVLLSQLDRPPG